MRIVKCNSGSSKRWSGGGRVLVVIAATVVEA